MPTLDQHHHLNLANGMFDGSTYEQFQQFAAAFAAQPKHLLVHFHGGLVSQQDARASFEGSMMPQLAAEDLHPFFFVWQTGWKEIIRNNLTDISSEEIFKILQKKLYDFLLDKLKDYLPPGFKSATGSGLSDADLPEWSPDSALAVEPVDNMEKYRLELELQQDVAFSIAFQKLSQQANGVDPAEASKGIGGPAAPSRMDPQYYADLSGETTKGLISSAKLIKAAIEVGVRVVERFRKGRHHGVLPTLVEELLRQFYVASVGKILWDAIKKDAADAFQADPQLYGGTAFVQWLKERRAAGQGFDITLSGHSAGSIFVCHFLAACDRLGLPADVRFNVSLMAPAVSIKLFAHTLREHGHRIKGLRIFNLSDALEQKDAIAGPVYPLSLLYFVSGLLEAEADEPLLGMQRYLMRKPPFGPAQNADIATALEALAQHPDSLVYAPSSGQGGLESGAAKHGDFDNDAATLRSLLHFARQAGA